MKRERTREEAQTKGRVKGRGSGTGGLNEGDKEEQRRSWVWVCLGSGSFGSGDWGPDRLTLELERIEPVDLPLLGPSHTRNFESDR